MKLWLFCVIYILKLKYFWLFASYSIKDDKLVNIFTGNIKEYKNNFHLTILIILEINNHKH